MHIVVDAILVTDCMWDIGMTLPCAYWTFVLLGTMNQAVASQPVGHANASHGQPVGHAKAKAKQSSHKLPNDRRAIVTRIIALAKAKLKDDFGECTFNTICQL